MRGNHVPYLRRPGSIFAYHTTSYFMHNAWVYGSPVIGWSTHAPVLTGRVPNIVSLYCSFTPLPSTGHIAQWQGARTLCYRSWVRSRGGIITFYFFLSFTSFSKSFFIVLFPLIQFNVNYCDYLYMLTVWILYFNAITGLPHTHALCMK